jgi:hypothetical protein
MIGKLADDVTGALVGERAESDGLVGEVRTKLADLLSFSLKQGGLAVFAVPLRRRVEASRAIPRAARDEANGVLLHRCRGGA